MTLDVVNILPGGYIMYPTYLTNRITINHYTVNREIFVLKIFMR